MSKEEWMRKYVGVLPTSGKEYEEMLLENFNNRNQMCVKLDRQVSELKEENQQLKKELEALQRKEEWLIVKTTWAKPKYAVCKSEQVVSHLHSDFTPQINTSFYFIVDKFKTKEEAIKKLNEMKGE
jgi:predicted RNase H-like nuclease (RuvC/YqgF family)